MYYLLVREILVQLQKWIKIRERTNYFTKKILHLSDQQDTSLDPIVWFSFQD